VCGYALKYGKSTSCGCFAPNLKHGMHGGREYWVWQAMIQRCTNPNTIGWQDYGGRGITVCDRWRNSFEAFWADLGPTWAPGLSLDRIDNDGNYEPSNVRLATQTQQARNQRKSRFIDTPWGRITIPEAAERSGISGKTIRGRMDRGWPDDRLFEPVMR
jgi:hypothetical protein